ncbi:hypothetical protein LINGRAPRIM_LOCUS157 [Linum grandiflorum]
MALWYFKVSSASKLFKLFLLASYSWSNSYGEAMVLYLGFINLLVQIHDIQIYPCPSLVVGEHFVLLLVDHLHDIHG